MSSVRISELRAHVGTTVTLRGWVRTGTDGREATGLQAYQAYGRETTPIFRRLGIRSSREIQRERHALKALRGDFAAASRASEEVVSPLPRRMTPEALIVICPPIRYVPVASST